MKQTRQSAGSSRGPLLAIALIALGLQGCGRSGSEDASSLGFVSSHKATPALAAHADFRAEARSPEAAQTADWIVGSGDNRGQPFAIIDKREARLFVFSDGGKLVGSAPVLLGAAKGDDTVPGIGERPIVDVKPFERTTPAGRFVGEHGSNMRGEQVIWIDYDAAVSMHPVLTTNPAERRLERLASPDPEAHRISYGCVNVPRAFFADVVLKTLGARNPVIYVLPETRPLSAVFAGLAESSAGKRADLDKQKALRL